MSEVIGYFRHFNQTLPFEYTTVSRMTTEPQKHRLAHYIWHNKEQTKWIIEQLCKKFNISYKRMVLHLRDNFGEERGGSRAGYKNKKPWMSLALYHGCINAQLICHEFAHVIHYNRRKQIKDTTAHGRAYTEILDRVIVHYFTLNAENTDILAILSEYIQDEKNDIRDRGQAVINYDQFNGVNTNQMICTDDEILVADFIAELEVKRGVVG